MVTLARSGKGLGGEKQEKKGENILARPLFPARKLHDECFFLFYIPVLMSVPLTNGNREMRISST